MKNIWIYIVVFLAVLAVSYGIRKSRTTTEPLTTDTTESETEGGLPAAFLRFYDRFHTDTVYQIAHIPFPIDGIKKDSTGVRSSNWQRNEWIMMKKPMNLSSFTIRYDDYDAFIDERISDRQGRFTMVRRFLKMDTTYVLSFYEEMGPSVK